MEIHKVRIELFGNGGQVLSTGTVFVQKQRVSMGKWVFGGEHVVRRPLALIRRLALAWVADGADREYQTMDEQTLVTARLYPAKD